MDTRIFECSECYNDFEAPEQVGLKHKCIKCGANLIIDSYGGRANSTSEYFFATEE